MGTGATVELVEVDQAVEPDDSFPGAYAFFIRLSREPSPEWIARFAQAWREAPGNKRPIRVEGRRLRVAVSASDSLQEAINFASSLVRITNDDFV